MGIVEAAQEFWSTIGQGERRRAPRVRYGIAIEVSGFDRHGRYFTERTSTCLVSDTGCQFCLGAALQKDAAVAIRVVGREDQVETNSGPVLFRLAWVAQTPLGWKVGAEQLASDRPWSVDFPRGGGWMYEI